MRRIVLALAALLASLLLAPAAHASATQESLFQDDDLLIYASPQDVSSTLDTLQALGVDRIRVSVFWRVVAPAGDAASKPAGFDAANPDAYPAGAWDRYDTIVRLAAEHAIAVNFNLTSPAPNWATGTPDRPDIDPTFEPDAAEFGQFVRAVGTRYDGAHGQGRVASWGIWNEPNQAGWLTPQWAPDPRNANRFVEAAPRLYRALADTAYDALQGTGHGTDTILVGETAPKGLLANRGETRAIDALRFVRALYCLDSHLQFLKGSSATVRGCPESDQVRRFPAEHPALFHMSGWAHHPYELIFPPNRRPAYPDWATIANLGSLSRLLHRTFQRYGQPLPAKKGASLPLYLTEFGYQTDPPDPRGVTPAQQAAYLDQSEYIAYRDPTVRTLSQFLLRDDRDVQGFQSGLETADGELKPAFSSYRLPVFLPSKPDRKKRLRVWGLVRGAADNTPATVQIQVRRGTNGAWQIVRTYTTKSKRGYLGVRVRVRNSGAVRLAWTAPSGDVVLSREAPFTLLHR